MYQELHYCRDMENIKELLKSIEDLNQKIHAKDKRTLDIELELEVKRNICTGKQEKFKDYKTELTNEQRILEEKYTDNEENIKTKNIYIIEQ